MIDLVWTRPAGTDRREIFELIAADSPSAARRMDVIFAERAGLLARFPEADRSGRIPGTRELLAHRHYILIYRVREETVQILRLLHTARQWPPEPSLQR